MSNPITRFSSRAEAYAKYRPGYPFGVVEILESECGLTKDSVVADVGSGTGILTELLLKNGNRVFGIEPNEAMRVFAEETLKDYQRFESVDGSAEATPYRTIVWTLLSPPRRSTGLTVKKQSRSLDGY